MSVLRYKYKCMTYCIILLLIFKYLAQSVPSLNKMIRHVEFQTGSTPNVRHCPTLCNDKNKVSEEDGKVVFRVENQKAQQSFHVTIAPSKYGKESIISLTVQER